MKKPEEILNNHLQALGSGDIEALMQDYSEESVFISPNGAFKGVDVIKGEFRNLLAAFPPGSTLNILKQLIKEDYILLMWSGESNSLSIPFASDTFVIKDGKIIFQSFAGQMIVK